MRDLTDLECAVLAFERGRWNYAQETAIGELFGLSPARYYQLLGALLDRPEALTAEPAVVIRLRRLRDQRTARRTRAS